MEPKPSQREGVVMCTFPDSEYRFRLCIEQVLISVGLVSGIGCPPLAEHQVVGSEQSAEPVPTDRELLSEVLLTENVKPECCPIFTLWVIIGLYPVGISGADYLQRQTKCYKLAFRIFVQVPDSTAQKNTYMENYRGISAF